MAAVLLAAPLVAGVSSGAAASTQLPRVSLRGMVPHIPADVTRLGSVPADQRVQLDITLAGRDPSGLAGEVAAVSTPGSPDYRHYLSAAQFAAAYGPTATEVGQVSSVLRGEGLTVGTATRGSALLPVSGPASVVSAALDTPLEAVRLPDHLHSLVNLAAPQIPASLSGAITGVVGLDGLAQEHDMLLRGHAAASSGSASDASPALSAHDAGGPQACSAASRAANGGSYTSTQLASDYGLDQLFAQGRTGIGQTIGIVEFEQYSTSDIAAFQSCYGLSNSIRNVVVDGPVGGPSNGAGEAALDIELASVNAPSASIVVYEAPNQESDAASVDLFDRIASDDQAQTVTTSWGICEALNAPGDASAESGIFSRMAAQGQTVIAAAGDSGSEDCFDTDGATALAIDDPGAQPDVVSAGGTTLLGGDTATQSVWNDCEGDVTSTMDCAPPADDNGAGGGGYSQVWGRPTWQPAYPLTATDNPCSGGTTGCRAVPDISGSADPNEGVAAYFGGAGGWTVFGGTSAVAPSDAALFADIDQGCNGTLGMAGPALYSVDNGADYTDVTTGNNDFTDTNGGQYAAGVGYDPATGLGTPQDQNLALALQGGDGCPAVSAMSAQTGPVANGAAITIAGGGLADATSVTFGSAGGGQILSASETSLVVVPPSATAPICVDVTVTNPDGTSVTTAADRYSFGGAANCDGNGYRFVASDGGIFDFGSAPFEGSTGGLSLSAPIVGMADTPSSNGYWLVASDGGVFSFGDAHFFGSMGAVHLNRPIVGMAATPDGGGYWLVASDGGIFSFGDAAFYGSTGAIHLNQPIVGMAATPDGNGYWMVASDGGIFAFGDAAFFGSTGGHHLSAPIVGMAATQEGGGYWLVASDGGVFGFGDAPFLGSMGGVHLNQPIVGMAATSDSGGYWLVASDGGIFTFGDAAFYGSTGAIHLNRPIVGMASG